jgi:acetyltransferase-like isoleucine patch superfamily enzyme
MNNLFIKTFKLYKEYSIKKNKKLNQRIENGTYRVGKETSIQIENLDFTGDGCIHVGSNCKIMSHLCTRLPRSKIQIGDRCFIGVRTTILSTLSITIGNDVMIAGDCYITDNDGHSTNWRIRRSDVMNRKRGIKCWDDVGMSPVSIGNDVWIAPKCIILKGVSIGDAAVVAAGSVITKDIPPRVIVAGNPARIIREIE